MNSIRRRRSRPRVDSVNFRTLWWVLTREAVFAVHRLDFGPDANLGFLRNYLAVRPTSKVRSLGEFLISHYPERRCLP